MRCQAGRELLDVVMPHLLRPLPRDWPLWRAVLVDAVRCTTEEALDWDARLVLRKSEVPKLGLDGRARLGWTAWLPARIRERDPDDLVLRGARTAV